MTKCPYCSRVYSRSMKGAVADRAEELHKGNMNYKLIHFILAKEGYEVSKSTVARYFFTKENG
jgi:hypothetical protein